MKKRKFIGNPNYSSVCHQAVIFSRYNVIAEMWGLKVLHVDVE
jgi:hypothetical protein